MQQRILSLVSLPLLTLVLLGHLLNLFNSSLQPVSALQQMAPPLLVSHYPTANSHTVPVTTAVSALFDQPILPTTINSATIFVHSKQIGLISGTYNAVDNSIYVTPSRPFPAGDFVQVSVTTGTQNLSGEELEQPTVWQFRTAVAPTNGQFTPTNQILSDYFAGALHVGDFNQDSYMDILIIGSAGSLTNNRIWFNDGQNNFWPSTQLLGGGYDRAAVGDLDNDGDLDIVVGNYNERWLSSCFDKRWFRKFYGRTIIYC